MNNQGRDTKPVMLSGESCPTPQTFTGNWGLQIEEDLIFEYDSDTSGVDLPPVPAHAARLGSLQPRQSIGLPDLSEPQIVRHYTRLSQKNYGIDTGLFPLGSCTMKHNPRLNEKAARLAGFAHIHPLQPQNTVQGAIEVLQQLSDWLLALTGMEAVALSPAAGAHGEFCGMLAIRAALEEQGQGIATGRDTVLIPESAHGTNPATAAMMGYKVESIPANESGRVDMEALKAKLGPHVAAIMLTNPNTCGLFESDIVEIAEHVHKAGAYFYCDGANFNAIVGRIRPSDLGIDAMHINLHKTFSTPHGGGGPGSGPVVFSKALAPFVPVPYIVREQNQLRLIEQAKSAEDNKTGIHSPGRLKAYHGQMGMFTRALTYILSHGADGLWQASGDAVLNANYILSSLKDCMTAAFDGLCMHEALFDDRFLNGTGVTTLDFAKAMLDEGYHPMTMYFPLVVRGAFLIEPTETESRQALDQFIAMMRYLAQRAKGGDGQFFKTAPHYTPRFRLDETKAARAPRLKWQKA